MKRAILWTHVQIWIIGVVLVLIFGTALVVGLPSYKAVGVALVSGMLGAAYMVYLEQVLVALKATSITMGAFTDQAKKAENHEDEEE